MRLSLLFSMALGLVALLAMSERMPGWLGNDDGIEAQSRPAVVKATARSQALPGDTGSGDIATPSRKEHGRIYKWRDARGGIHIASEAPPADVQTVIIPFVRERPAKSSDRAAVAKQLDNAAAPSTTPSALLSVYTPEGFADLLERVEETAIKLHQRSQQLKSLESEL